MTNLEPSEVVHRRRWLHLAAFTVIPIVAALSVYAFLPKTSKAPVGMPSGCDHFVNQASGQSCPHGMDANGGCNMNAGTGSASGDAQMQPVAFAGKRSLEWVLPEEWTSELNQGGMRYATLRPKGSEKVDVSVVPLGGVAGGELANVNRWRGQIGLEPITDKERVALRMQIRSQAGPVTVFDLSNPKNPTGRMVVGILSTQAGDTWFLKMVGEHEPAAKAKPAFLKLLESLRGASQ